ncbi:MAG: M23 family metallopeptidase [Bacteroidota bacterium]
MNTKRKYFSALILFEQFFALIFLCFLFPNWSLGQSLYKLPFKSGSEFICTCGNNDGMHQKVEAFAFDFGLPLGTDITAMRDGVVTFVVDGYENANCPLNNVNCPDKNCIDDECKNCANYVNRVVIKHDDGTKALYLHLNKGSIVVSEGDRIVQGQVIAKSGNSGCSTNPHLHVMLMDASSSDYSGAWYCKSIPLSFCDFQLQRGVPVRGDKCKSIECTSTTNNNSNTNSGQENTTGNNSIPSNTSCIPIDAKDCQTKNSNAGYGHFCFKNGTTKKIKIEFGSHSPSGFVNWTHYQTLQPGESQCFYELAPGPYTYVAHFESSSSPGNFNSSHDFEGDVYVVKCQQGLKEIK